MVNNGVTRATLSHYLAPGQLVPVEVAKVRPKFGRRCDPTATAGLKQAAKPEFRESAFPHRSLGTRATTAVNGLPKDLPHPQEIERPWRLHPDW